MRGKGYGARAVGTPIMVLFNKAPSGIPDSGIPYAWFILTALVNIRRSITQLEMRSDNDEIHS